MRFIISAAKENITYENSDSESSLKVRLFAIAIGTKLPLRDEQGGVVATFEASEALIQDAVLRSKCGLITLNHNDPIESRIGVFSSVSYDSGFVINGEVTCPRWKERIVNGQYTGLSVEGKIEGEMTNPSSMEIYAVSILSEAQGACPLVDSEGNQVCRVEVLQDDDGLESNSIEAAWDGSAAEKQIWNYATDENGEVIPSKAKKCFLKVDGDPTKKGSYSYPYVAIINGKTAPNRDGLLAALKFASGAMGAEKNQSIIRKIKTIMNKSGMELPPSLQARLEQKSTIENGQQTIVASVFDPTTDEVLDSQKILVINSIQGEHIMAKKEEKIKVEAQAEEAIPVVETPEVVASVSEAVVEAAVVDTPAVPAPAIEVVAPPVVEKTLDWSLVSQEFGIKSKDEFNSIKEAAGRIPSLEEKINGILKENESLKSFKIETEKKWLLDSYPPAITKDIAAAHAEFTRDPAAFVQKYAEDSYKFKAASSVKLQGSAAESSLTEEAKKMQARKEKRDGFLKATGGPVIR
jgi:hypothetical protein